MPTYSFRNKETGDIHDEWMSMSAKDQYLIDNPHLEQTITVAPRIVSGVSTGSVRNDDGFKEVMSKVAEAHPNSAVGQQYGKKDTKAAKTAEIAKKHGF